MEPVDDSFGAVLRNWVDIFVRRSMRSFVLYSKQKGLSMTQIAALIHIRRKVNSSVSEISDELQVSNPAASQLIERLVQQGLIARTEDPNDRRLKQIALTDAGETLLREGLHSRLSWLEDLAKLMTSEEKETVTNALTILLEKMKQMEEDQRPSGCPH